MIEHWTRLLLLGVLAGTPCFAADGAGDEGMPVDATSGREAQADPTQSGAAQSGAAHADAARIDAARIDAKVESAAGDAVAPGAAAADAAQAGEASGAALAADAPMESVEAALANLERDLAILEEDLLYPPSSRVAVYLSLDVGELFALDEVEVKLNGDTVAHHLYTARQVNALARGGVQRLFVGNAKQGSNEITAFFLGRGAEGRELRRGATATFDKGFEPLFVELQIRDSETLQRPEMSVEVH